MWTGFPLFPDRASTLAPRIDALFFWMLGVSTFFTVLIFVLVLVFAVKYRRRSDAERPAAIEGNLALEVVWTAIPLVIVLVTFVWGAREYFVAASPPPGAIDIFVIGRQWMWKFQHPDGRREINELHVPAGRPVRLTLVSEDVIHSLFVPAFRVKMDVVPGRMQTLWFEATRPGTYHLFCAEYCGTQHSGMVGRVVVLDAERFEEWLGGGAGESLAQAGERAFFRLGCATCHRTGPGARGPDLTGVFGSRVRLREGGAVTADEGYLRESILDPQAKVTAGFDPVMPAFRGQVNEETLLQLLAYVKSLAPAGAGLDAGAAAPPPGRSGGTP